MASKRLYRSQTERMIAGVCGGLAEYFDVDPTIVRVAFVFLTLFGGTGIALYILMWILVPERGQASVAAKAAAELAADEKPTDGKAESVKVVADSRTRAFWGVMLILLGGVLLLQQVLPWRIDGSLIVPTVLVAIGLVIVARSFES